MDSKLLEKLGIKVAANTNHTVCTVSQINNSIKKSLEEQYSFVIVTGEVSNFKQHSSGHRYFSLSDQSATLQVVGWRGVQMPEMRDGMKVVCRGKITAYPGRSQFQLVLQSIEISGQGDLYKIFQQLKQEMEAEGLFDPKHKKPLPKFPKKIGVITGHNSDAEKDILKRIEERLLFNATIKNVLVQGDRAGAEIAAAIEFFNNSGDNVEVLIVSRGGGSMEDLAAFNDPKVVRAIFASSIPVISAVGHEMDVTLADYVADVRAPTPTASIEILLPLTSELRNQHQQLSKQIQSRIIQTYQHQRQQINQLQEIKNTLLSSFQQNKQQQLAQYQITLAKLASQLAHTKKQNITPLPSLHALVQINQQKLRNLTEQLTKQLQTAMQTKNKHMESLETLIDSLSHTNILARGFTIVTDTQNNVLTTALAAKQASDLCIEFQDGQIAAKVTSPTSSSE